MSVTVYTASAFYLRVVDILPIWVYSDGWEDLVSNFLDMFVNCLGLWLRKGYNVRPGSKMFSVPTNITVKLTVRSLVYGGPGNLAVRHELWMSLAETNGKIPVQINTNTVACCNSQNFFWTWPNFACLHHHNVFSVSQWDSLLPGDGDFFSAF